MKTRLFFLLMSILTMIGCSADINLETIEQQEPSAEEAEIVTKALSGRGLIFAAHKPSGRQDRILYLQLTEALPAALTVSFKVHPRNGSIIDSEVISEPRTLPAGTTYAEIVMPTYGEYQIEIKQLSYTGDSKALYYDTSRYLVKTTTSSEKYLVSTLAYNGFRNFRSPYDVINEGEHPGPGTGGGGTGPIRPID